MTTFHNIVPINKRRLGLLVFSGIGIPISILVFRVHFGVGVSQECPTNSLVRPSPPVRPAGIPVQVLWADSDMDYENVLCRVWDPLEPTWKPYNMDLRANEGLELWLPDSDSDNVTRSPHTRTVVVEWKTMARNHHRQEHHHQWVTTIPRMHHHYPSSVPQEITWILPHTTSTSLSVVPSVSSWTGWSAGRILLVFLCSIGIVIFVATAFRKDGGDDETLFADVTAHHSMEGLRVQGQQGRHNHNDNDDDDNLVNAEEVLDTIFQGMQGFVQDLQAFMPDEQDEEDVNGEQEETGELSNDESSNNECSESVEESERESAALSVPAQDLAADQDGAAQPNDDKTMPPRSPMKTTLEHAPCANTGAEKQKEEEKDSSSYVSTLPADRDDRSQAETTMTTNGGLTPPQLATKSLPKRWIEEDVQQQEQEGTGESSNGNNSNKECSESTAKSKNESAALSVHAQDPAARQDPPVDKQTSTLQTPIENNAKDGTKTMPKDAPCASTQADNSSYVSTLPADSDFRSQAETTMTTKGGLTPSQLATKSLPKRWIEEDVQQQEQEENAELSNENNSNKECSEFTAAESKNECAALSVPAQAPAERQDPPLHKKPSTLQTPIEENGKDNTKTMQGDAPCASTQGDNSSYVSTLPADSDDQSQADTTMTTKGGLTPPQLATKLLPNRWISERQSRQPQQLLQSNLYTPSPSKLLQLPGASVHPRVPPVTNSPMAKRGSTGMLNNSNKNSSNDKKTKVMVDPHPTTTPLLPLKEPQDQQTGTQSPKALFAFRKHNSPMPPTGIDTTPNPSSSPTAPASESPSTTSASIQVIGFSLPPTPSKKRRFVRSPMRPGAPLLPDWTPSIHVQSYAQRLADTDQYGNFDEVARSTLMRASTGTGTSTGTAKVERSTSPIPSTIAVPARERPWTDKTKATLKRKLAAAQASDRISFKTHRRRKKASSVSGESGCTLTQARAHARTRISASNGTTPV